jgi:hypothetical protein
MALLAPGKPADLDPLRGYLRFEKIVASLSAKDTHVTY